MKVSKVLTALERIAPASFAFSWDHIGLQVGSPNAEVSQGLVCLDLTLRETERLKEGTLVVCHHPIIWDPLSSVREDQHVGAILAELIRKRCAFIAAHTNWDAAPGGVNDTLAERLGLTNVRPFGRGADVNLAILSCFVPKAQLESVIEAASKAGAGNIGNYTECAFHGNGIGQFRPNQAANPTKGSPGKLEQVEESRLEMVVPLDRIASVDEAIKAAHPYEEPAYTFTSLHPRQVQPLGRIGELEAPMLLHDFRTFVDEQLNVRAQAAGDPTRLVKNIAVIGGAGGDEWREARNIGADVFLTGEFKHNVLIEATAEGMALIEAGHFATEQPGMETLWQLLGQQAPEIEWKLVSPKPGESGMTW